MNLVMILATKVISDLRQHHLHDDCNSSFPGIVQRKTRRCSSVPPTPSPTKSTKQQFQPALCRIFCVCWLLPIHRHTHIHLTALCPGLPRWAGTRKVKPIWILLKQETVSDTGISWAICKSAPRSRQIIMPAPHHSVFYRPDALPATQPTV